MTGNAKSLEYSLQLLLELRVVGERLDHLFSVLDPPQHRHFVNVRAALANISATYKIFSAMDPTFFHGRSLIYNRETEAHTDRRDKKLAWTPVLTVGTYDQGILEVLNLEIEYLPGTLVLLRGGVLKHSVRYSGGQRVAIAHFMHQSVVHQVDPSPLPITTFEDILAILKAGDDAEKARKKPGS